MENPESVEAVQPVDQENAATPIAEDVPVLPANPDQPLPEERNEAEKDENKEPPAEVVEENSESESSLSSDQSPLPRVESSLESPPTTEKEDKASSAARSISDVLDSDIDDPIDEITSEDSDLVDEEESTTGNTIGSDEDSFHYSEDDEFGDSFDYDREYEDNFLAETSDSDYSTDSDSDEYDFEEYIGRNANYRDEPALQFVIWDSDAVPTEKDAEKVERTRLVLLKFLKLDRPSIHRGNYDAFNSRVSRRLLLNFITRNAEPFAPLEVGSGLDGDIFERENVRRFFEVVSDSQHFVPQEKVTEERFMDFKAEAREMSYDDLEDDDARQDFLSFKAAMLLSDTGRFVKQVISENFEEITEALFCIFRPDSLGNFYHFSVVFLALFRNSPKTLIRLLSLDNFYKFRLLIRYLTIQPVATCVSELFTDVSARQDMCLSRKAKKDSTEIQMDTNWITYFMSLLSGEGFVFIKEVFSRLLEIKTKEEVSLYEYFFKGLVDRIAIMPRGMEVFDPFMQDQKVFGGYLEEVLKMGNDNGHVEALISLLHYTITKSRSEVYDYSDMYSGPAEVENSIFPAFSLILETLYYKTESIANLYLSVPNNPALRTTLLDILTNLFDYFVLTTEGLEKEFKGHRGGSHEEIEEFNKSIKHFFHKLVKGGFISDVFDEYFNADAGFRNQFLREIVIRFYHVAIVLEDEELLRALLGEDMANLGKIVEQYLQERGSLGIKYYSSSWLILNLIRLVVLDPARFPFLLEELDKNIPEWDSVVEKIEEDTREVLPQRLSSDEVSAQLDRVREKYQDIQDRKKAKLDSFPTAGGVVQFMNFTYEQDDEENEAETVLSMQMNILEAEILSRAGRNIQNNDRVEVLVKPYYISVNEDLDLDYYDNDIGLGSSFARRLGL